MADTPPPPKKQKLSDTPPPPPSLPSSPPPSQPPPPTTPPPLSQEEILRRRRNQEEIRNVFECYKRINFCIEKCDKRSTPELEEAYLSLINASRGGTSAQRLVAEYIPRYASYCPTSLEAAANVLINMHNWCTPVINRGEDADGIAFETAKACTLGLIEICKAATTSKTLNSAVIQGICTAVFLNIITFFLSSFEGQDIFQIVDHRILKIKDVEESFFEYKREFLEEDNSASLKLSKIRALSFLKIFFSHGKHALTACFELFESSGTEGAKKGNYFLRQLTIELDDAIPRSFSKNLSIISRNCLLGLVLDKDRSIKNMIFSRYRKLCHSASPEIISEITSVLEGVFESFAAEHSKVDGERSPSVSSDPSYFRESKSMDFQYTNRQTFSPRARTPRDFRTNSFNNSRSHSSPFDSPTGPANSPFDSPKHNMNHVPWSPDGDPSSMDVFPASKQLWVASLGHDASELNIRFLFEKFGPIDQVRHVPFKGFAYIEFRSIMDAVKAREVMRGRSPWGSSLRIKFLDMGPATRETINGVPVGSSCHVYIGNAPNKWIKDEILREVAQVVHKGPRMVTDLSSEGALLVEFDSPKEAAISMARLRWYRKGNSNNMVPSSNVGPPANVDSRNSFSGSCVVGSPQTRNAGNAGMHHNVNRPDGSAMDLTSPRMTSQETYRPMVQNVHSFQSTWSDAPGSVGSIPTQAQGPQIAPPPPQIRPVYAPPNSLWDNTRGSAHHPPLNPIPCAMPPNAHANNMHAPPFLPPSVTPLANIQGNYMRPYSLPAVVPPPLSSLPPPPPPPQSDFRPPLPPQPDMPPPLPPTPPPPLPPPPPPPHSQSPPPPPPPAEAFSTESSGSYSWQGILSKSGVYYCTMFARRVISNSCNYSSAVAALSEPVEWPAKLDMTKRTDFRHVKSTFSSTPPHRREVCWLLPSSEGDHKGFQDFISYLKQRDCSGVIKIPASKSLWSRLLFILPYSSDACDMLSIPPNPSLCLIGLILPKETNSDPV